MTRKKEQAFRIKDFERKRLSQVVLAWFHEDRRTMPWRKTRNPYRIVVSEVMLQQTQVSRVAVKYQEFLRQFPALMSLAHAKTRDVIRAWSGLGYNVRALRLQKFAQRVVSRHDAHIPKDPKLLLTLPGIGKYTGNAIASFAFHEDVPVVDTNIRRVLSRLFSRVRSAEERMSGERTWEIATTLVPTGRSREWNLALMDLGATICTSRRPRCEECPANSLCKSAFLLDGKITVKRVTRKAASCAEIPDRIYRGRIVEALRRLNGRGSIRLDELGQRIKAPFRWNERPWLRSLVLGLERDGLVRTIRHSSHDIRVSLP